MPNEIDYPHLSTYGNITLMKSRVSRLAWALGVEAISERTVMERESRWDTVLMPIGNASH